MKRLVKNPYVRDKDHEIRKKMGIKFEQLLRSWGFKADEENGWYRHVNGSEFYGSDINFAVVDLISLKFVPFYSSGLEVEDWGDIEAMNYQRLHLWTQNHPHKFTSRKFGI